MKDEEADNPAIGNSLGHYRILKQLGAGGMGEVYLAEDSRLRRKIALKVLPENIAKDKDRLRRFEQEAFAASALNHPNILTIYEFGAEDETHFLAAEFVEGETLRERLGGEGVNFNEALDIVQQTAFALSAAHAAGIVHRDIKPENIMIRRDGIVKVLDFGLAKLTEKRGADSDAEAETRALVKTNPGVVMGTVSYMSPEQARGKETDARTDLWSLGVVLYEMLARKLPFAGETMNDAIAAILTKEPPLLAQYVSTAPTELQRIVRKALTKERDERYQTARDLMIDLKTLRRELDLRDEIDRSTAPQTGNASVVSTDGNAATQTFAAENTAQTANNSLSTKEAAYSASSAEYVAAELKRHKLGLGIGLIVLLLASIGLGYWFFTNRSANTTQIESIAVMPFVNESGNADNEYLSDGMTETLISSLSQIPKLNVKARSSVFRYKGKDTNTQTIGKELNVQAILNGRIVQRGQDLTLYVELVDAATENVLWKENYNKPMSNLISLQTEIARDVSQKLKTKLSGADEQKLAKNYTENVEAYQLYLKGRFYWNKRSPDGLRKAVEYFKQAIALDPNYALAYTGLADSYSLLPVFDSKATRSETMPLAKEAALKALSLNDNLAEAHASLAVVLSDYDGDWAGAEQHYKRALELNPNYPTAHQWYGEMLVREGRFDEGLVETRRALELDPFSLIINLVLGINLNAAHRYDEAINQIQKTLELDPSFADANDFLFEVYANKGMHAEAAAAYARQMTLDGESPSEIEATRDAFAKSGWNGFLRHIINHLESLPNHNQGDGLASFYARLGNKDKAFAWLEKAYDTRSEGLTFLKVDARFDNLRDDPRYKDLLKRMNLPE